jgi:hypothetical protein
MEEADAFREEQEYEETGPRREKTIDMYRAEEKEEWRAKEPEQKREPTPKPAAKHKRVHGGEDGEGTIRVFRGKGAKKKASKPSAKETEEKRPYGRREPSGGFVDEIEKELGVGEKERYKEEERVSREQEKAEEVRPPSEKKAPREEVEKASEYYEEQEYVEEEELEEEEAEEPEEKFVEAPREKEAYKKAEEKRLPLLQVSR